MPQLGETVAEGKITKWFKSAGDAVKPGDNLFEIETDKVSMEVPSITAGTLTEIRVPVGETALVGAVVAVIAGEGGAAVSAPAPTPAPAKAPTSRTASPPVIPAKAGIQGAANTCGSTTRDFIPVRSIRSSRCGLRRVISALRRPPAAPR